MSFRIPCGGFELDENSFSLENKKLSTTPVSWDSLKDKPFYEETTENVLLPETTINNGGGIEFANYDKLYDGMPVVVVVDGTTYNTTVRTNASDSLDTGTRTNDFGIGSNMHVSTSTRKVSVNGNVIDECNFLLAINNNDGAPTLRMIHEADTLSTTLSYTVEVYSEVTTVKTIDPKFIKDMYYEESPVIPEPVVSGETNSSGIISYSSMDDPSLVAYRSICEAGKTVTVVIGDVVKEATGEVSSDFYLLRSGGIVLISHTTRNYPAWETLLVESSTEFATANVQVKVYPTVVSFDPIIKQIDPKFIPAPVFVVRATINEGGTTTTYTADKTVDEVLTAIKSGQCVVCEYEVGTSRYDRLYLTYVYEDRKRFGFSGISVSGLGLSHRILKTLCFQDSTSGLIGNFYATSTAPAVAVADAAGDTPTAAEFNALLTSLRNAGILAT